MILAVRCTNNRKRFFLTILFFFVQLLAAEEVLPAVQSLVVKHFTVSKALPEEQARSFFSGIASLNSAAEKFQALTILAAYEDANYLYADAAKHYSQAVLLTSSEKTACTVQLSAARSYIMSGDSQLGAYILNTLIARSADAAIKHKAEIYVLCAALNDADKFTENVQTIKHYLAAPSYTEYRATLYFLLYWLNDDEQAKTTLIKSFPSSMEALLVQNKASVSPVSFWYLMPRKKAHTVQSSNDAAPTVAADNAVKQAIPKAYQVGFFKTKSYAEDLLQELIAKGFAAYVESKSAAQTYTVLVPAASQAQSILKRLKDAGYEAYPVFE